MGEGRGSWFWLLLIGAGLWFYQKPSDKHLEYEPSTFSALPNDNSEVDTGDQLEDGSYDCVVRNTDRSNGPYDLSCDKNGDEIIVTFPNGGYRTISVGEPEHDGNQFTFEGSDDTRSESWEIEISK